MADPSGDLSSTSVGPYKINLNQRLPIYCPTGTAFESGSSEQQGAYAILIDSTHATRVHLSSTLRSMNAASIQTFLASGTLFHPAENRQKLAIVFDKIDGLPLMDNLSQTIKPLTEDKLRNLIMLPMLQLLEGLSSRGIYHGRIRPDTIYLSSGGKAVASECISCLAGLDQPSLFEPLERAMTMPAGRGDGTASDDLFALGMTMLFLALGHHPFPHLSDEEILQARMEEGTWGMILSRVKVPHSLIDPLRGLLSDHPKHRWNHDDVVGWLDGQRIPSKAITQPPRATRSIEFNGKHYARARSLAAALPSKPAELQMIVARHDLDGWVRRSLGDQDTADYLHDYLRQTKAMQQDEDNLVAYVSIALDPLAPLRYKDITLMPDGVGTALVEIVGGRLKINLQVIAECLTRGLIADRLSAPQSFQTSMVSINKLLENARRHIDNKSTGFGIERVLYELNKSLPCQSDMFRSDYILTPKELLLALNKIAQSGARPASPLDRHGVAFLATHDSSNTDAAALHELNDKDPANRNRAVLNTLAHLQYRYNVPNLSPLAGWMAELIRPAIDKFHSKKIRTDLLANIAKIAKKGDLTALQNLVTNQSIENLDKAGFYKAREEYKLLTQQIATMQFFLSGKGGFVIQKSRKIAASMSFSFALMGAATILFMALQGL